eukprot:GHVO01023300.1.p1 GENE.GHVO01023300.1~~GHVO01023300.1.p1  ORF type:complete len:141 (+),score=6.62 GHVO01023300.1:309-731(+)
MPLCTRIINAPSPHDVYDTISSSLYHTHHIISYYNCIIQTPHQFIISHSHCISQAPHLISVTTNRYFILLRAWERNVIIILVDVNLIIVFVGDCHWLVGFQWIRSKVANFRCFESGFEFGSTIQQIRGPLLEPLKQRWFL